MFSEHAWVIPWTSFDVRPGAMLFAALQRLTIG
jgi:hypothetical protein